jgi:cation:H+ antiporter
LPLLLDRWPGELHASGRSLPMVLDAVLFVASLFVLSVGADLFVRGASALAARLGLSALFVGLVIVGFGTSMPEFATSVAAALRGFDGIAVGNVVGSNIFNVAGILGLLAVLRPVRVAVAARGELVYVLAAAVVPFAALPFDGVLGRTAGALLLVALGSYVWRAFRSGRSDGVSDVVAEAVAARSPAPATPTSCVLLLVAGLATLVMGSELLVHSAGAVARAAGVSDLVIGLTIVAFGTSAPELVTSLVALRRGEADLAVGNVFGSNVFNVLGVLGATCVVEPQTLSRQVLVLDTPVMLLASAAMLPAVFGQRRMTRLHGALLVAGYVAYTLVLWLGASRWFPSA